MKFGATDPNPIHPPCVEDIMKYKITYPEDSLELHVTLSRPFFGDRDKSDYEELEKQVKRHCENVGSTSIQGKMVYVTDDGEEHESKYDAIVHEVEYDGDDPIKVYRYSYYRLHDGFCKSANSPNGMVRIGTGGAGTDFRDLISDAADNPHEFRLRCELTDAEQKFLDFVLAHYSAIVPALPPFPSDISQVRF